MIDPALLRDQLAANGLGAWACLVEAQLEQVLIQAPHGDWARWCEALATLPDMGCGVVRCVDGAVALEPRVVLSASGRIQLQDALQALHPWRKGPYRIGELLVDTEWRSDWKWQRLLPHIAPLDDRLVLDVGCGNGYHCWRMALSGARLVVGIDPSTLFLAQFLAIARLAYPLAPDLLQRIQLIPVGIEALPAGMARFDTVFSMGVLYHRRSPIDHLLELRGALRPGGQLVLETLVVDGSNDQLLVPRGRYAKMRNVWFIPTTAMLENWLQRCGFRSVQTVDVTVTTPGEQRATDWMRFESLADFLHPADTQLTIEGYPAPMRAITIAEA